MRFENIPLVLKAVFLEVFSLATRSCTCTSACSMHDFRSEETFHYLIVSGKFVSLRIPLSSTHYRCCLTIHHIRLFMHVGGTQLSSGTLKIQEWYIEELFSVPCKFNNLLESMFCSVFFLNRT